jgi:hypothetical protein
MRNLGIIAFGVTTCVLVPTALHLTEAGPKQVAKLVAPGERSLAIGKAKVQVALDRAFLDPGDKVHVTLTATGPARQHIALDVLVLESTGTGGGRVETPPDRIARETVALEVGKAGAATKQLAFTLPGGRGREMEGLAAFGHYTILVMPPGDADKFERLRRRAQRVDNPMDDRGGRSEAFLAAYRSIAVPGDEPAAAEPAAAEPPDDQSRSFGTPGQIARLDVNTRPKGSPLAIEAPDTAHTGDDLAIRVKIRNPSNRALAKVTVSLSARPDELANGYLGIGDDHVAIENSAQDIALAAHETKRVVFHVSASAAGTLGLFATARCDDEACYQGAARRINDAALDAIDITQADGHPIVGAR